jgi:hypothetical protein
MITSSTTCYWCGTFHIIDFNDEELHNLYSLPNIVLNDGIKEDELGGHTRKEDKRNVHRILF